MNVNRIIRNLIYDKNKCNCFAYLNLKLVNRFLFITYYLFFLNIFCNPYFILNTFLKVCSGRNILERKYNEKNKRTCLKSGAFSPTHLPFMLGLPFIGARSVPIIRWAVEILRHTLSVCIIMQTKKSKLFYSNIISKYCLHKFSKGMKSKNKNMY